MRTLDIEEVGKTTRHATFFQMAGNFSFGDYFKEGAIPFAWELLTGPSPRAGSASPSRSCGRRSTRATTRRRIWQQGRRVSRSTASRRGTKDNYWSWGSPDPAARARRSPRPGPGRGAEGGPVADEDRYLEVWNLVFMQHELSAVRSKTDFDIAGDLPAKNIDTGMGLERMAAVLQGVDNIYEIDTTAKDVSN